MQQQQHPIDSPKTKQPARRGQRDRKTNGLAVRTILATRIPALRLDTGCRTLRERYFPAMESTQRYGRRGVSNPPSCTSPQRPLIRRGGWLLGAIRYAICRGGPSGCIAGSSLLTVDFLRDTMAKEGSFDRCFPEDITKSFPHFPLFFPQNKGFFRKETIDVVVLPCRRG